MTRMAPWGARILLGLVLLAASGVIVGYFADVWERHTASALLSQVSNLQVGRSSTDEVLRIVRQYGGGASARTVAFGCPGGGELYWVQVGGGAQSNGWHSLTGRLLGNRWWMAQANFRVADGRVTCAGYHLRTISSNFAIYATASSTFLLAEPEAAPYDVAFRDLHNVHELSAGVRSDASAQQRRRAFDFDFSCLSRIGGCRGACEIMPSAWLDYQKQAPPNGRALPSEEADDPLCKKLEKGQ